MLKGIDTRQKIEYSLESDTDPKTVFVLKPLSGLDKITLTAAYAKSQEDGIRLFLRKSIVEIKNYSTADIDEAIETFSDEVIGELMGEINNINAKTGDDEKNS
jgi:hypothetical protein